MQNLEKWTNSFINLEKWKNFLERKLDIPRTAVLGYTYYLESFLSVVTVPNIAIVFELILYLDGYFWGMADIHEYWSKAMPPLHISQIFQGYFS